MKMNNDFKKFLFHIALIALGTFAICVVLEIHYIHEDVHLLLLEQHNSIIAQRITRIEEILE